MNKNFLSKKSWHTGTLKNIEQVWLRERRHSEEQKQIEALKREIAEKEQIQELRDIHSAATGAPKRDRVDWLYDNATAATDSESYLLGRRISDEVRANFADKPGALFGANVDPVQDAMSKVRQDPLLIMKKQEQQSLKQILDNPVKMMTLQQEKMSELIRKLQVARGSGSIKKIAKIVGKIRKLLILASKDKFAMAKLKSMVMGDEVLAELVRSICNPTPPTATPEPTTSEKPEHHKHHKHHHKHHSDTETGTSASSHHKKHKHSSSRSRSRSKSPTTDRKRPPTTTTQEQQRQQQEGPSDDDGSKRRRTEPPASTSTTSTSTASSSSSTPSSATTKGKYGLTVTCPSAQSTERTVSLSDIEAQHRASEEEKRQREEEEKREQLRRKRLMRAGGKEREAMLEQMKADAKAHMDHKLKSAEKRVEAHGLSASSSTKTPEAPGAASGGDATSGARPTFLRSMERQVYGSGKGTGTSVEQRIKSSSHSLQRRGASEGEFL